MILLYNNFRNLLSEEHSQETYDIDDNVKVKKAEELREAERKIRRTKSKINQEQLLYMLKELQDKYRRSFNGLQHGSL